MIRNGSASPVQFAGHFTVPEWGCGTGCTQFVIVDSRTGRVYDTAFVSVSDFPGDWIEDHHEVPNRLEFEPDSRLFKVNGCPEERDCGFYDFEFVEGIGFKLLRKELLPENYQP